MEYIFIISGVIISLGLFAYLFVNFDKKFKRIAVYFVSAVLSLLVSKLLLNFESEYLSKNLAGTYIIEYSFYLTMVLFLAFSTVINITCLITIEKTEKLVGAPLMMFLTVSKIGCFFNGCCYAVISNITIPLNLIESGLSFLVLVLVVLNKIKPDIIILAYYSIFRLITDFFKINYEYESLSGLTMLQILYIAVIIVAIILKAKNHLKEINYEKK